MAAADAAAATSVSKVGRKLLPFGFQFGAISFQNLSETCLEAKGKDSNKPVSK